MLSFFPRGVFDEILNLIESVSEDFPSYSSIKLLIENQKRKQKKNKKNASFSYCVAANDVILASLRRTDADITSFRRCLPFWMVKGYDDTLT